MPTKEGKKTGNKLYNECQQKQKKLRTQRLEFYLSRGTMWIIYIYIKNAGKLLRENQQGGRGQNYLPPPRLRLTRKTLKCNSLVQKIWLFLQKETSHCRNSLALQYIKQYIKQPSSIFLAATFTRKIPRSSNSIYSFYFMLENIWHHHFTWSGPNS